MGSLKKKCRIRDRVREYQNFSRRTAPSDVHVYQINTAFYGF